MRLLLVTWDGRSYLVDCFSLGPIEAMAAVHMVGYAKKAERSLLVKFEMISTVVFLSLCFAGKNRVERLALALMIYSHG